MAIKIKYQPSSWTERISIVGLLAFSFSLIQFTTWKESRLFWIDAGGYPIWLRDVIKSLYYPYLLFVLTVGLTITRSAVGRFFRQMAFRKIWYLLILSWVIIVGCLGLLLANNLINLIEGRDLHYHEWDPTHGR
ncbi:MAG: hypothetical protein AAF065_04865 [Verrucomicrobiota bacterium]